MERLSDGPLAAPVLARNESAIERVQVPQKTTNCMQITTLREPTDSNSIYPSSCSTPARRHQQLNTTTGGGRQRTRPAFHVNISQRQRDLLHLGYVGGAVEQDGASEQFRQDAAGAPHVDGGSVNFGAEQQLRRTIPAETEVVSGGEWIAAEKTHQRVMTSGVMG